MKIRLLYLDILIASLITVAMVSCRDAVVDPPVNNTRDTIDTTDTLDILDTNQTLAPPTHLQVASLDGGVALKWNPSVTDGVQYQLKVTDGISGEIYTSIADVHYTVSGLTNGVVYTFTLTAVKGGKESDPISITGAPATRAVTDMRQGGTLRIYPRSAIGKANAIVIEKEGVYSTAATGTSPDLSRLHLIADVSTWSFKIGVPQSFTDFQQVSKFRKDVQISDTYVVLNPVTGLDGWYMDRSIEQLFLKGSTDNFALDDRLPSKEGMGFAIRWGMPGAYRYARIFVVPAADGWLIQKDSDGDDFIEIQISY